MGLMKWEGNRGSVDAWVESVGKIGGRSLVYMGWIKSKDSVT